MVVVVTASSGTSDGAMGRGIGHATQGYSEQERQWLGWKEERETRKARRER